MVGESFGFNNNCLCMQRFKAFLATPLDDWKLNFVVGLSAKHCVMNRGHNMAHALQHFVIRFLKSCRVSLNMIYG